MSQLHRICLCSLVVVVALQANAPRARCQPPAEAGQAAKSINEDAIRGHIRFLADDLLEGRGPGTRGDQLTQRYIATQLGSLGLQPAAPGGGWYQPVPLVGITTKLPPTLTFQRGDQSVQLKYHSDFIGTSGQAASQAGFRDAEVVFVGYGIVAPEYDWNDYKGVDLKGKLLLMMNNDPSGDPELFAGKRRLYYGRWDYKYEMAARQGAAGAIIIHTTPSAGYPFQVVQTSWSGEEFELKGKQGPRVQLKSWVTNDAAEQIVSLSGKNLDKLRAAAEQRSFRPVPLGVKCSVEFTCQVREQETANVMGVLPGSDPELQREMVIFMAHHDHLGMAQERNEEGDRIYNGAVDNASGVAALLTIAKACSELPQRPARSLLFATVGAEEQGLLGSAHMAAHPPAPAGYLAALVNIDGLNILGRTHDVNAIGYGKSSLDEMLEKVASWQNRHVTPDHFPDRGFYYRSDQFSLAKIGVPGIYLHGGTDVVGKQSGWGTQQREDWEATKYHQPSDEYEESWNLEGAVEDVRLLFHVGLLAANSKALPRWKPGDEFEAARKAALEAR